MWETLVEYDRELFRFLNGLFIGEYDAFWIFVTAIENWIPLYLLFFYFLLRAYKLKPAILSIVGVFSVAAATLGLTNLVKNQIARLRPNNEPVLMDSIRIYQTPENFSFWSGHSAVSFAVATFVAFILVSSRARPHHKPSAIESKWLLLIFIWPVTFALSRIMVGVHYPFDVIVGMVVGVLLGYAFAKAYLFLVYKTK